MKRKDKVKAILDELSALYPDAGCSLDFTNALELWLQLSWQPSVLMQELT